MDCFMQFCQFWWNLSFEVPWTWNAWSLDNLAWFWTNLWSLLEYALCKGFNCVNPFYRSMLTLFGLVYWIIMCFRLLRPTRGGHRRALKTYVLEFGNICFEVLISLCSGEAKPCEAATAGPRRPRSGHEVGSGPGSSSKTGQYSFVTSSFVANIVMHVQEIIVHRPKLSRTQVHYPQSMNSMNTYLIFSDVCARCWRGIRWTTGTNSELFLNGFDFGECG